MTAVATSVAASGTRPGLLERSRWVWVIFADVAAAYVLVLFSQEGTGVGTAFGVIALTLLLSAVAACGVKMCRSVPAAQGDRFVTQHPGIAYSLPILGLLALAILDSNGLVGTWSWEGSTGTFYAVASALPAIVVYWIFGDIVLAIRGTRAERVAYSVLQASALPLAFLAGIYLQGAITIEPRAIFLAAFIVATALMQRRVLTAAPALPQAVAPRSPTFSPFGR